MNFNHSPLACESRRDFLFPCSFAARHMTIDMNWQEKSHEIASELLDKMEDGIIGSYTRQDVLDYLAKAAYMGMRWECDNWVLKRTK